jgi:hypothetical protein
MKPPTPTRLEAAHLDGLRVVLIDKRGKMHVRMPFAALVPAVNCAKDNSYEFTAIVAYDAAAIGVFKDGAEVESDKQVDKVVTKLKLAA